MSPRKRRRRGSATRHVGLGGVALFFFGAVAALAAVWFLYRGGWLPFPDAESAAPEAVAESADEASREPAVERPADYPTEPEQPAAGAEPPPVEGPPPLAPADGAYVALVIDDLGRSVADVDRLAALGVPLTYAVLPFESRTPQVAAALERRGAEMLLHLPMQGQSGADPGPGALALDQRPADMQSAVQRALAALPGAVGVNNHMGSVLTADAPSMRLVLDELAPRNLFFLDSRTTADSVAYRLALDLGMPAAERDVFLDADLATEAVRHQFRLLLETAHREGSAIGIGHPHPVTMAVLAEEVPLATAAGYHFVPVSSLLDRSGVLPE